MSSRLHQTGLLFGFVLLWVSAQFLGAIGGPIAACICGALIGLLGTFAARFFSLLERPAWLLPLLLGGCSLLGIGITSLEHPLSSLSWLAAPLTILASGTIVVLQTLNRRRCGLCTRRLSPGALTFTCPRCALVVCDESCWSFEHRRCQLCVEHRVPLLSAQKQWWDRTLGPEATQGRCQVCMASFEQSDLRHCGRCRRLQCRDCWDNLNGECARCSWTIPDLPDSLQQIASSYNDARPSHQHE
ncbi:hypothetical protein [Granulicella arctica]|uniref:Uncharacterized protein n=1 Tax=Granulicella arctica TaxID=940613 RepID=A0A7Y9PF53_9BACT|nr:hypothetical protein [Granulicella arctica]NYF78662.1 hypothetical protein [Granulicella arctica]